MTALMRLVELDSGSILLDGVNIQSVGLTKLRSNIAVIPQVRLEAIVAVVKTGDSKLEFSPTG
jgi:ABC-type cobalamin/Fe3+-siderophores transport system ATPase subunit